MKKLQKLFVALAMMQLPLAASAQATLSIEPFSIKAGEEKEMVVDLTNPGEEITLVQFDLRLPDGLQLKQVGGEYDIDMCDRTTWRRHSLDANATEGIIRFLLASSSNTVIDGTEGTLIKMTLVASNGFESGTIGLENILLVSPDEKESKPANVELLVGDLILPDFVYFIGATDGWSNAEQRLAKGEAAIYTGFAYVADPNGWGLEFKFLTQAGSWDHQLNSNNLTGITGDVEKGSDNIVATADEGVYFFMLNLSAKTLNAVRIYNMNLVGDFNGWNSADNSQQMFWDAENYCYVIQGAKVSSYAWKFTSNNNWDINLGGETDNLVADGANIDEEGSVIKLYPTRKTSDNIYCTVETPEEAYLSIAPGLNIRAGEEKEMVVDLTNPEDEITLVQFDLRLPDGLLLKQVGGEYDIDMCDRTTWRRHSLDANATEGIIRFLLASNTNTVISGTEGALIKMTLTASNSYKGDDIRVEHILLVTPDEKEIKPADIVYKPGNSSGISAVVASQELRDPIYSLSGQRLAAPKKGINIVGGRKVVVR